MRPFFFIALVVFGVWGCHKSDEGTITFNKAQFPLKVGNWWRYMVNDFYAQTTDTLTLSVVSEIASGSGIEYRCTLVEQGVVVDSGYFKTTDAMLEYNSYNPNYSYFGNYTLRFPFNIGDQWNGIYLKDTITATARTASLDILGNTYQPVYTLDRRVILPGYSITQDLFITPEIGVIYQNFDVHDGSLSGQKQTFQLIDYKVN